MPTIRRRLRRSLAFINEGAPGHTAVLLDEVLESLAIQPGGAYVDATFGDGGHSRALAARLEPAGQIIALDRDPTVRLPGDLAGRVTLICADFRELDAVLDGAGTDVVDGVLFDFGISSTQLDRAERGFSFILDGELDMRLNPSAGQTAYDLLATTGEPELASLIATFGGDRAARRIARSIVAARARGRLPRRTTELARLIAGTVQVRGQRERIHPATRTFQALRIAVNDELGAIARGLDAAIARTRPGGRIVAISFHSLEDRIVKQRFRSDPRVAALTKKPVVPSVAEIVRNPRARSAKLRVAERLP